MINLIQHTRIENLKTVEALIKKGADVDAPDNQGLNPPHWVACKRYNEIIELLIVAGVNIEAKGKEGWTPLYQAASQGQKVIKT